MTDALAELSAAGVAVWLDDLSRNRLDSDSNSASIAALVKTHHVVGITSNPTIFAQALSPDSPGASSYADALADARRRGISVEDAVYEMTTADVRVACDKLREVYEATNHLDGRVSIEVDPGLAHDTVATVAQAAKLWRDVDRPNLFIKIPATVEGLPAVTKSIAAGISVNVTLIFSLERHEAVMEAYLAGMEQAHEQGRDLAEITSVASFFVSRVDTEVDKRLDAIVERDGNNAAAAKQLRGTAAIANARLAYQRFQRVFTSKRWFALAEAGARPQRPLWASTGVKDPNYDDTRYVTELVATGTVNTMPEKTLLAVADHGKIVGDTVTGGYDKAEVTLAALAKIGVDYDDVVTALEREAVKKFKDSWRQLLDSMDKSLNA
ncbi:MAG TPA: transaldolase [Mycobacteriales bacterium]|nr:transaldolase [Mycobacteriales bacterium]